MKLDILVLAAHPDDAELCIGGIILSHIEMGKKVGIVDLTRGEMGTRGTPETRLKEAEAAADVLGLSIRENLGLKDVFFQNDVESQMKVVEVIRKYQPEIILANAPSDRHPDHVRASQLVTDAVFKAGLIKVKSTVDGQEQKAWKTKALYHFLQNWYLKPDLVVDVTPYWEQRTKAVMCYKSQFYNPDSDEPETVLSSPQFLKLIEARARELGYAIGVEFAEGLVAHRQVGARDLFQLI